MKKEQIEQAAREMRKIFEEKYDNTLRGIRHADIADWIEQMFLAGAESRQAEIDELSTKLEHSTKWTSCSIRMPDGVGRVLVKFTIDDNDDEIICEAMHDGSGFYGYYVEDLMCDDRNVNFIAWLPYPY